MIAIIDYDAGNLKSVEKALVSLGEEVLVSRDSSEILQADKVILPGVGSFGDAMNNLDHFNLVDTIKTLKKHGVWVYGAEADGTPIDKADLSGALALVIGSEGFGLGKLVRENCDVVLSLPMFGKVNSLNASVCAGILMYEAVKYR